MLVAERQLSAGDLQAVFVPSHGMIGISLRHRGVELLRRLENLDAAAEKGRHQPQVNTHANFHGRKVQFVCRSVYIHNWRGGVKWDFCPVWIRNLLRMKAAPSGWGGQLRP